MEAYLPSEDGPAIVLGIVLPYFRLSNPTHVRFFPPRQVPCSGLEQVPVLAKQSEMGNDVRKFNHMELTALCEAASGPIG